MRRISRGRVLRNEAAVASMPMSDSTSSEKVTPDPASDEKKTKSRLAKIILSAGAFVAAAIAVLANGTTFVGNVAGWFEPPQSTASALVPHSTPSEDTKYSVGESVPLSNFADSECFLVDKGTKQSIDCSIPHNAELFSAQTACSDEALFEFLGADLSIDTLRHDLQVTEIPNTGCQITLPSGIQVAGSLKMSLPGDKGDFLRQCYDAIRDRDVGCEEVHTAEVVGTFKNGSTTNPNCMDAAEVYLGVHRERFDNQLSVEMETSGTTRRCIAKARGENILTATLRNISQSALPLSADDGSRT